MAPGGAMALPSWGSALLVGLLLLPGVAGEPWLQYGHDAARTGATADPGPSAPEVAFTLDLPGDPTTTPPILAGREVLVLRSDSPQSTLYAIDLDTARVSERVVVDGATWQAASDGERIFVEASDSLQAFDLTQGAKVWQVPLPRYLPEEAERSSRCIEPAVTGDTVYIGCTEWDRATPVPVTPGPQTNSYVLAVNATTGHILWTWTVQDELPSHPPDEDSFERGGQTMTYLSWLAVSGDVVLASVADVGSILAIAEDVDPVIPGPGVNNVVWAIDRTTGTTRWEVDDGPRPLRGVDLTDPEREAVRQAVRCGTALLGGTETTYLLVGTTLYSVVTKTGDILWRENLVDRDAGTDFACGGSLLATAGGSLFVGSFSSLYRIDPTTRTIIWKTRFDATGEHFDGSYGIVLAGGKAYVRNTNGMISALHAEDGSVAWRLPLFSGTSRSFHGITDGVLAFTRTDGTVAVVGRTGASLQPAIRLSTDHPATGATVRADLSASRPGALGTATAYRAEWGDGSVTDWQSSPVLEHAYALPGPVWATFWVRNDAGQTSQEQVLLDVGATPESLLQQRLRALFSDHADTTWGLLGLGLVLFGGAFGVLRVRRSHDRLRRELGAIEEAALVASGEPGALERAMKERRQHVRALLLDRMVDEGQFAILDNRINELQREMRLDLLDERLPFLPHGLAQTLRKMLSDGHINSWEHETVATLVTGDAFLTKAQKTKVMRQLEAWREQDAA